MFSKPSLLFVDNFIISLRSKEKQIASINDLISIQQNEMLKIKDEIGSFYQDENLSVSERSKKFIENLKKLEIVGEKYDKLNKDSKIIYDKINQELTILISNIKSIEKNKSDEDVRNQIFEYIKQNS